jgi:DNA-binding NarL/FixJ family response regulator
MKLDEIPSSENTFIDMNIESIYLQLKKIGLTDKEKLFLQYLVDGESALEIGERLSLAQQTVHFYLNNIKSKLLTSLVEECQELIKSIDSDTN